MDSKAEYSALSSTRMTMEERICERDEF